MLGLGEGELHFLRKSAGEVVAADRDGALPDDASAVGDDEVGRIGADLECDDARLGIVFFRVNVLAEEIVRHEVAQRERAIWTT